VTRRPSRRDGAAEINFFVIDSDLAILRKGIEQRIGEFREALAKPG
jgi:hypothetical protein